MLVSLQYLLKRINKNHTICFDGVDKSCDPFPQDMHCIPFYRDAYLQDEHGLTHCLNYADIIEEIKCECPFKLKINDFELHAVKINSHYTIQHLYARFLTPFATVKIIPTCSKNALVYFKLIYLDANCRSFIFDLTTDGNRIFYKKFCPFNFKNIIITYSHLFEISYYYNSKHIKASNKIKRWWLDCKYNPMYKVCRDKVNTSYNDLFL